MLKLMRRPGRLNYNLQSKQKFHDMFTSTYGVLYQNNSPVFQKYNLTMQANDEKDDIPIPKCPEGYPVPGGQADSPRIESRFPQIESRVRRMERKKTKQTKEKVTAQH